MDKVVPSGMKKDPCSKYTGLRNDFVRKCINFFLYFSVIFILLFVTYNIDQLCNH